MLRIITICTGNVCRSPLASAVLSERLSGLEVSVSSAGTRARAGMPMTAEAVGLAVDRGVDPLKPRAHIARLLQPQMLLEANLILTMTRDHRRQVVEMLPAALRRTLTIREFSRLAAQMPNMDRRPIAPNASAPDEAVKRFESALALLVSLRGLVGGPATASDDDVVDPFGRSMATYERSAAELDPGLLAVERFVNAVTRPDSVI